MPQRHEIEQAIAKTFNAIEKALSNGYTVSITDYSSFQKSVNFRASTKMKKRIGVSGFEKSER